MEYKQQTKNARRPKSRANATRSITSGWAQSGKGAPTGQMSATTATTGIIVRNIPLFPYRTKRTLQYYTNFVITPAASSAGAQVFSANGLFDPDITGTGGQPMGFDQMMNFYNHYTVVRSRIRAVVTNMTTNLLAGAAVVVSGSSTVTTVIETLMENGDLSVANLGYTGQMGSQTKLVRSINAASFQGIDDVMDDPNMRGDSASNPTEQLYFHVAAWNPYSSGTVTINGWAIIEYEAVFHEPRKGPLS